MDMKKAHLTKLIVLVLSLILIAFFIFLIIANVLYLISRDFYGSHLYYYYILIIIIIIILDITSIRYLNQHHLKQGISPEKTLELQKKEIEKKGY